MSYNIYIGISEEMTSLTEVCAFSEIEHKAVFKTLKTKNYKFGLLSELEDYRGYMNYTPAETKILILELENILTIKIFKNNSFLKCLLYAGKEAVSKNLELIGVGE